MTLLKASCLIKLTYLFQSLVTVLYVKGGLFKTRMEMIDVTGKQRSLSKLPLPLSQGH